MRDNNITYSCQYLQVGQVGHDRACGDTPRIPFGRISYAARERYTVQCSADHG